ncbi:MAG: hypothetical protein EHM45_10860 [Desulfobacteraceae bacterium]|nr:MAG: hypothetical protein EHM45_10860 [Desulfobacteraceae bacterium]
MAEETEKEEPPAENEPETAAQTPEAETEAESAKPKTAKRRGRLPSFAIRLPKLKLNKRWVRIGGFSILILILIGGVWFAKDHWIRWGEKIDLSRQPKRKLNQDRSIEEKLNPFFIPILVGEQQGIAVIDFSVIWDGLASVRYKKTELEIRDTLFEHMKSLAEKDENFKDQALFLEEDMARILRRALGVEDLKVKIKDIKLY